MVMGSEVVDSEDEEVECCGQYESTQEAVSTSFLV